MPVKVRFSRGLATQTEVVEAEVRLARSITVYDAILVLYTLFPGLLVDTPGRASRDVIARRLQLRSHGLVVGLEDELNDDALLTLDEIAQSEGD